MMDFKVTKQLDVNATASITGSEADQGNKRNIKKSLIKCNEELRK